MKAAARTFAALVAIALFACGRAPSGAESIAPAVLAARLDADDAPVVLDVRTPGEFEAGHIPGAINIPHTEVASRLGEIEPFRGWDVVVHCKSGGRAARAEQVLADAGFERVLHLEGDIVGWASGGYPIE